MAVSLGQFLIGLAADPAAASEFRSSQAAARKQMTAAGLNDTQQTLVLSNDSAKIAQAVEAEFGASEAAAGIPITISFNVFPPPN